MVEYLLRRLILVIPVVLGVSLLVFFMIHLIPGDPAELILGDSAHPSDVQLLRQQLGLNEPIHHQLVSYYQGLITLDLGESIYQRIPVSRILVRRFPATLELTMVSMFVAVLIALPLGILAAVKSRSFMDSASMFFALLGVSMPNFWLGPLLLLVFYANLGWMPPPGRAGLLSYILPAVTLGTAMAAILTRMTRSSLLDVIQMPYMMTARSKGISGWQVILKHGLKNALIPVVTILGLQFGALLGGSIITETIFSWPGVGRELIQAIQGRDYPVVQGCVLVIALSYVLVNLMTDLVYGFLDPRISYSSGGPGFVVQFFRTLTDGIRSRNWLIPAVYGIVIIGCVSAGVWFFSGSSPLEPDLPDQLRITRHSQSRFQGFAVLAVNAAMLLAAPILLVVWSKRDPRRWQVFRKNPGAVSGLIMLMLILLIIVMGPILNPYDPIEQNLAQRLNSPSFQHPFGTDDMGRDLLSRVLVGGRISVYIGITVTMVSAGLGIFLGVISGLMGGWFDELVMRIVDILLAFPGILLAIALVAVLGPDINNVIIALCLVGWVGYARLARGQALSARENDYVQAALALGARGRRIAIQHILPNIFAPLIVQATLGIAGVIVAEAGLSFLGLGVQPPAPSWGSILDSGREFFHEGSHITVFPGLAIMLIVMSLNFLGDGLRDAFDPRFSNR